MINLISFQGLGSPVFNKLEAQLARAAMSLPASIGFEFGSGFAGMELVCRICLKNPPKKKSSKENNDTYFSKLLIVIENPCRYINEWERTQR